MRTVPYDTTCCPACRCGGGCRFAQAAVNRATAHDRLVEALETIQVQTQDPAIERLCAAALEEAKL